MKARLFLYLFLIFPLLLLAEKSEDFEKEVDELFEEREERLKQVFLERINGIDQYYNSFDDDNLWVEGHRIEKKMRRCLQFLTASDNEFWRKVSKISRDYRKKNYDKTDASKDFKKMMNRKLRKQVTKGIDEVVPEENYKFCPFDVSKSVIEKNAAVIKEGYQNTSKPDFSDYHPRDQKLLNKLFEDVEKKDVHPSKKLDFVYKTFLTKIYPMLNSSARLEFLPNFKKKCPDVLEEYWSKCKGKDKYQNRLYKSVPKMYCLKDHKSEIDKKCFELD